MEIKAAQDIAEQSTSWLMPKKEVGLKYEPVIHLKVNKLDMSNHELQKDQ